MVILLHNNISAIKQFSEDSCSFVIVYAEKKMLWNDW